MSQLGTNPTGKNEAEERLARMVEQGRSFSSNERNCVFLNTAADGRFATISAVSGLDFPDDGRALAIVDWDQDGYPDLWISNRNAPRLRFMRNDHPHVNHFVSIQLQGNGVSTNRDAIGARVELMVQGLNGKRLVKSLKAGEGFISQSTKWLHFGLGQLTKVDKIIVRWPAGSVEEFPGAEVDERYVLVQGSGRTQPLPAKKRDLALKASEQTPFPETRSITVPLVHPLPLPREAAYIEFNGTTRRLPVGGGKPLLVAMWASWCRPCHSELAELAKRYAELKAAGVEVLALALDGLQEDSSTPEVAQAFIAAQRFPFSAGRATEELTQTLMWYHHTQVVMTRQLPIPVSFLVDGKGRMTTIYKGPVNVDQVLLDSRRDSLNVRESWLNAACLPGSMLDHAGILSSLKLLESNNLFVKGYTYARANQWENALTFYQATMDLDPEYHEALPEIALALDKLGRTTEALPYFTKALRHFPDRASLHFALGETHARAKRYGQAAACYREALRLDPAYQAAAVALKQLETNLR